MEVLKIKNLKMIQKILFLIAVLIVSSFLPFFYLRVFIGIAAVVLFLMSLGKFRVMYIIFAILFLLLPSIFSHVSHEIYLPWIKNYNYNYNYNNFWGNFDDFSDNRKKLTADKKIDTAENIEINIGSCNIKFVSGDEIYIPSEINYEYNSSTLSLNDSYESKGNDVEIIIGTDTKIRYFSVNSIALSLSGNISTEKNIHLDCDAAISLKGVLKSDKNIYISAPAAAISAEITSEYLEVNSASLAYKGLINSKKVNFDTSAVDIKADVGETYNLDITSSSVDVTLLYIGVWEESKKVNVSGTVGSVTIDNRDRGPIQLTTSGMIKVTRND